MDRTTDNRDMHEVERDLRAQVDVLRKRNVALKRAIIEHIENGDTEMFSTLIAIGGLT